MKLHLVWPFVGWLLSKIFSGVIAAHKRYQRNMKDTPGLMVFAGTICSVLFTALTTLLSVMFLGEIGTNHVRYVFVGDAIISLGYVICSFFNMLFNSFLEERKHLFNVLKDE